VEVVLLLGVTWGDGGMGGEGPCCLDPVLLDRVGLCAEKVQSGDVTAASDDPHRGLGEYALPPLAVSGLLSTWLSSVAPTTPKQAPPSADKVGERSVAVTACSHTRSRRCQLSQPALAREAETAGQRVAVCGFGLRACRDSNPKPSDP
jgi:hypothetical protein